MKHKVEGVKEWVFFAKEDFKLASLGYDSGILPEILCFHAQQSVEKGLKALLIQFNLEFPKTHNIKILFGQLASYLEIPENLKQAEILTDYAVSSRYPGVYERVDQEEYEIAVKIAKDVLVWVELNIG